MATGSGKTFTAITAIYRLIKFANVRRVLFLVDRGNLGRQALKEFQRYVTPDDGRKFTELYRRKARIFGRGQKNLNISSFYLPPFSLGRSQCSPSRSVGVPRLSSLRAERLHDRIRVVVYHGQQYAGGPVWNPAALFPVLHGAHIKAETVCEFLPAQLQTFAKSDDPLSAGVVHDPAGKRCLTAHMGKHLAQGCFNLLTDVGVHWLPIMRHCRSLSKTSFDGKGGQTQGRLTALARIHLSRIILLIGQIL